MIYYYYSPSIFWLSLNIYDDDKLYFSSDPLVNHFSKFSGAALTKASKAAGSASIDGNADVSATGKADV